MGRCFKGGANVYNIIDATEWNINYAAQARGTRVKKWLIEPATNQLVLAKWPSYASGEIYAEKITSQIGQLINIPVMKAEIGKYDGELVVLAFNILRTGEELIEGGDFFEEYDRKKQRNQLPVDYSFQQIKAILKTESLIGQFIDMLLLDCLIFNSDRHQDNWGICVSTNGESRLAPAYDNSSSLGWNLTDDELNSLYKDRRRFEAFINRSSTLIGYSNSARYKHFKLMQQLKEDEARSFNAGLDKIAVLNNHSIQDVVNAIPEELMSELRKSIVSGLLIVRRNRMVEMR